MQECWTTSAPSVSNMSSQSPSMQPSYNPSSEVYLDLVQTIYGDDMNHTEYNLVRKIAMKGLEQDQTNYNSSTVLSTNELKERYVLVLLYYVSNTDLNKNRVLSLQLGEIQANCAQQCSPVFQLLNNLLSTSFQQSQRYTANRTEFPLKISVSSIK